MIEIDHLEKAYGEHRVLRASTCAWHVERWCV